MSEHKLRRLGPALALAIAMLAAAALVLGLPDLGRSVAFLSGGIPTLDQGEAAMRLLAWLVVVVVAGATLLSVSRAVWRSRFARRPASGPALLLLVGTLLLVVGALQRTLPSAPMCCGSGAAHLGEAVQLAH